MVPDWTGYAVVCMASGPSLTKEDAELVRQWRESGDNRAVIVTNTTHTIAPWADVLYAMDTKWWLLSNSGQRSFQGLKITGARRATRNCPIATRVDFEQGGNSGAGAMLLAKHCGAETIIMLGYDCEYAPNGRRHWHGDHPKGLGNCESIGNFYDQFADAAKHLEGVRVINASKHTVIDFWPRKPLEDVLCGHCPERLEEELCER